MFKLSGPAPANRQGYFAEIADSFRKRPARAAAIAAVSIIVVISGFYLLGVTLRTMLENISLLIKCFSKG